MNYPRNLEEIVSLFEHLPEPERREMLISFAENSGLQEPKEGEKYVVEDVRKDEECTDEVGIFLKASPSNCLSFRVRLGPKVQTLTRAMTSILCRGLEGLTAEEVRAVPQDFVPRIVGSELVRLRSQTVYYVLTRMKNAAALFLNRQRSAGPA